MYRNYNYNNTVELFYSKMYSEQSYKKKIYFNSNLKFNKSYYISEIIPYLNLVIDSSDPDVEFPQIYHGYQTAEAIKNNYIENNIYIKNIYIKTLFSQNEWNLIPDKYKKLYNQTINDLYNHISDWSWLPLIGLIHDLGKVLILKEFGNYPEHFSVGDIYPLGCSFSDANIYYEKNFHHKTPDFINSKYNTLLGIYNENIGFKNIEMTFSHDYYLSQVFKKSIHNLPFEAIYIIQFHSFYAWHTPKNNIRGYTYLASQEDWILLPLLKLFQKSDLYSKNLTLPNIDNIKPYYNNLISQYIPNKLNF
jgi:inositol oxygenase